MSGDDGPKAACPRHTGPLRPDPAARSSVQASGPVYGPAACQEDGGSVPAEDEDDLLEAEPEEGDEADLETLDEDDLDDDDEVAADDVAGDVVDADGEDDDDEIADETAVVKAPATDDEDLDDEDLTDPDDVEASLDQILKERLVVQEEEEDEDEAPEPEDRTDGTGRVLPKQQDEFVCQSCFLVKKMTQLADSKRMFCRDCD